MTNHDISQAFVDDEPLGSRTPDEVLDGITLTWRPNTGISSAGLYWEHKVGFFDLKGVFIPVAVSPFIRELNPVPRSWAERAYPNLVSINAREMGNHSAAWPESRLLSEELRAGLRSRR
jgi:hypothetical protein